MEDRLLRACRGLAGERGERRAAQPEHFDEIRRQQAARVEIAVEPAGDATLIARQQGCAGEVRIEAQIDRIGRIAQALCQAGRQIRGREAREAGSAEPIRRRENRVASGEIASQRIGGDDRAASQRRLAGDRGARGRRRIDPHEISRARGEGEIAGDGRRARRRARSRRKNAPAFDGQCAEGSDAGQRGAGPHRSERRRGDRAVDDQRPAIDGGGAEIAVYSRERLDARLQRHSARADDRAGEGAARIGEMRVSAPSATAPVASPESDAIFAGAVAPEISKRPPAETETPLDVDMEPGPTRASAPPAIVVAPV